MNKGSMVDRIYRSLLLSKYFTKGWGSPKDIKRLLEFRKVVSDREECLKLVPEHYPIEILKDQVSRGVRLIEGKFSSPFDLYLPELLPKEVKESHFQMILPVQWQSDHYKPVCIHMAATGDHYYWRRRNLMAKPLLVEAGIASIIVENPFYGVRKPAQQRWSILNNVLDIFTMGGCLILEGLVLYNWCKKRGLGPIGFSGYSMGGHMASLAATSIPEPVILIPCLSWSTASGVFTEGVMSRAIDWELLFAQYNEIDSFKSDIKNMVKDLSEDAFKAGQTWLKYFEKNDITFPPKTEKMEFISYPDKKVKVSAENLSQKAINKWQADAKVLASVSEGKLGVVDNSKYEKKFALVKRLNDILFPNSKDGVLDWDQHEAFHFMKGIMDECTHIANFSIPVDTSLIISVCAKDDGYVPRYGVSDIRDIWPNAEVRYVEGGHVIAFVLHQKHFRNAIIDGFKRYQQKYLSTV